MIPVSVNLTTDGISGFNMGQAFTIPDKLLPYTYSSRKTEGFSKDRIRNVGFVAVGLTHKIENNQWDTSIRANMIFLKNKGEFNGKVERIEGRSGQFGVNASNEFTSTNSALSLGGVVNLGPLNLNADWISLASQFIAKNESFEDTATDDEGTPRLGFGSDKIIDPINGQLRDVIYGDTTTEGAALKVLQYEVSVSYKSRLVGNASYKITEEDFNKLNDRQKAALISFVYNVGSLRQGIAQAVRSGNYTLAAEGILNGPVTGAKTGKIYPGLVRRRKEEASLFLS
jgi:GH24 family phage-related lysozyme (muramidase)